MASFVDKEGVKDFLKTVLSEDKRLKEELNKRIDGLNLGDVSGLDEQEVTSIVQNAYNEVFGSGNSL